MEFYKKRKIFSEYLFTFSKFRFNFEYFRKNKDPHICFIFELTDSKKRG